MSRLGILSISMMVLLSACAQQQIKEADGYRIEAMRHLYSLEGWQFNGRLVVTSDRESFSVTVHWQHEASGDVIELTGPMGQGRVLIDVTATQVIVDDGESRAVYPESAEQVFARYFGVAVPVQAFRYWLLGLVEPGQEYMEVDAGFIQRQWRLHYRQMQMYNGNSLPRKINFEKEETKIKLVIDQWKVS